MKLTNCWTGALALWWVCAVPRSLAAEPLRDPMQPPPAARAAPAAATAGPSAAPAETPSLVVRHLLVVDGRRYVVEGGRRRGIGDLLGTARIERIEDTAVWVRQGGSLLRLPLFEGVSKTPSKPDARFDELPTTPLKQPLGEPR